MIASNSFSKEKLSAYQRWEMNSFETPDLAREAQAEASLQVDEQPQISLPAEEEVAAIFQRAKEEGYAAGLQEGNAVGYAEGRQIAEIEVKAEVARVQALLSKLDQELHEMDQQVADSLLELAVTLAQKVVAQALKLKPELIIPIVQEAIRNLPNAMQHPRLFLHPEDAKLVLVHLNDQLEQDHLCIREDEQISRGGCRIEASGSEINGSLEVRWQRVLSTIGQNDGWFEKKD
ncbi:flagellar assembly protein FliH [Nitrosomonas sp.]|uniref:flagellar assembly protein FliH n=1 Tax=Nitrosomonas sp. TaxID=42353 RepID=UPI0025E14537|nr:flagellar assembly protein FliH [Nitrosomonas sp.]MBY0484976.1 flagellar assembly protein FliH [Nitrosomonas sp.]